VVFLQCILVHCAFAAIWLALDESCISRCLLIVVMHVLYASRRHGGGLWRSGLQYERAFPATRICGARTLSSTTHTTSIGSVVRDSSAGRASCVIISPASYSRVYHLQILLIRLYLSFAGLIQPVPLGFWHLHQETVLIYYTSRHDVDSFENELRKGHREDSRGQL
jgi:hypothetical protein